MKIRPILLTVFLISSLFSTHAAIARQPKTFPVQIKVDFGPAQKAAVSKTILVEKGSTPKDVVSQVFSVKSGKACCSLKEVLGIDGTLIDPAKNWWWTCAVNGSKKIAPHKKKLKAGDVVEWKYVEEGQ